ncbi:MAG: SRPBCC domain-containing protein [Mycobacterium sp.]|nr:SRPBCC domain-containing protein [Mycobacterium sp.]
MTTLRHAIAISARRSAVYAALADIDQQRKWHEGTMAGEIAPGKTLTWTPKPGLTFGWRIDELNKDSSIVRTAVEGPGNTAGKRLTLTLTDLPDGRTEVALTDGEWASDDPHLAYCNTYWGGVLNRLKSYVEKS